MKKIIITLTLLLSLVPIQAICSTIPITSSDTNQIQQNCMVTILGPQQECAPRSWGCSEGRVLCRICNHEWSKEMLSTITCW